MTKVKDIEKYMDEDWKDEDQNRRKYKIERIKRKEQRKNKEERR